MDDYGILYKKIEAQDKIINEQVLRIAELNKKYENAVADYEEEKYKNTKATEYINKRMVHEGEYWIRKAFHFRNTEYGKDLLQILGEKENDNK